MIIITVTPTLTVKGFGGLSEVMHMTTGLKSHFPERQNEDILTKINARNIQKRMTKLPLETHFQCLIFYSSLLILMPEPKFLSVQSDVTKRESRT